MASLAVGEGSASEEDILRTVILVSRPVNESFNPIIHFLEAEPLPSTPCSAWEPGMNAPRLLDNLCFATHLAVGVVDTVVWADTDRSWFEKFREAEWWEHLGTNISSAPIAIGLYSSTPIGVQGGRWNDEVIGSIQAVEVVGTTRMSSERITQDVYDTLYRNWKYLPFWWNCQDFAVRIGALLVPDPRCWETMAEITIALKVQLDRDIIRNRIKKFGKFGGMSMIGAFLPFVGEVFLVLACSMVAIDKGFRWLDRKRLRGWLDGMVELNTRIPELAPFHRMVIICLFNEIGADLPVQP